MPIGLAFDLIFVLYLIDKHNGWRQAFKSAMYLALVCAVIAGGIYGWAYWDAYRAEKHQAIISACVNRNADNIAPDVGLHWARQLDVLNAACEAHPDLALEMSTDVLSPTFDPNALHTFAKPQKPVYLDDQGNPTSITGPSAIPGLVIHPLPAQPIPQGATPKAPRIHSTAYYNALAKMAGAISSQPIDKSDEGCSDAINGPYALAPDGSSCRPIYPEVEEREWNQLETM